MKELRIVAASIVAVLTLGCLALAATELDPIGGCASGGQIISSPTYPYGSCREITSTGDIPAHPKPDCPSSHSQ